MTTDTESGGDNIISIIEGHRNRIPAKTAFRWMPPPDSGGEPRYASMTFQELGAACESAAAGFKEMGLGLGDRVLVFLPMHPSMYIAMFAVQRLGAAAVFLDSWARRNQLGFCASLVEPRMMIAPQRAFTLCESVPEIRNIPLKVVAGPHTGPFAASVEGLSSSGKTCPLAPVTRETTALVTFTTGSSGKPKGADRTHGFLLAQHRALDACIPYGEADVDLPAFPIFSLNNLAGGVTTVLPAIDLAEPSAQDGLRLAGQILGEKVTSCTLSPYLFRALASACAKESLRLEGLGRVVTGGAPIGADDVRAARTAAPNAQFLILYGSTEVEPIAHVEGGELLKDPEGAEGTLVGPVVDDLQVRFLRVSKGPVVLDERGWAPHESSEGEPGEVVVAGEHVCPRYYRDAEATERAKISAPGGTIWHRTGDVGRLDEKGRLRLLGRVHNAILREGVLLFPVTPEFLMAKVEGVRQAAYLGMPDESLGEAAVAVVSLEDGAEARAVLSAVEKSLRASGFPVDRALTVAEIPMDPRHHSKVEYGSLREMLTVPE
jgi:acyl-CoA synthetase (AMP-forming)/AMP-acid ligase II